MKRITGPIFIALLFSSLFAYSQKTLRTNVGWSVNQPFQRDVFIENKGEFSNDELKAVDDKIVFFSHKGSMYLYFTPNGVIFRKDSVVKIDGDKNNVEKANGEEHEDGMRNLRVKHFFTKMEWKGSSNNSEIIAENETPDYFTFPNHNDKSGKSGIIAHGFTKLTYKNIYPGIDIEFFYPEKQSTTKQSLAVTGIEYNIIVHPGANPSQVIIAYSGSRVALNGKDAKINTLWGELTDHSPTAKDADGNNVSVAFNINSNKISFITGNYDKSKALVIDPWITATSLGGVNLAYDIGYDYFGNVYVYGGGVSNFYELQKFNSAGALQWTFVNNAFTYLYVTGYFYGDLTVDHLTGTSYMCEGFAPPSNHIIQVNSLGVQTALNSSSNIDEMWRIGYDYCNNQLVIITGGISSAYAGIIDTALTTYQSKNILSSTSVWDQSLLAFDNAGQCYIGTCAMIFGSGFNNDLCKMPLPSLTPTSYIVPDHHDFVEITNISYYPVLSGYVVGNGFNGLAATPTFVVSYDGGKMRKWNAATGVVMDSVTVSATSYAWGGLDIDCQGNIYCGNNKQVNIYDSMLNALGTIPLSNTVYDLLVAPNGNIYACGDGYVQCVSGSKKLVTVTFTPGGCACNGTATAHPCGYGPFTYLWSNGATTQTISNLCANPYTVTVTSGGCLKETDTAIANLGSGGGGFADSVVAINPTCTKSGSATAPPWTGNPPYTYFWSNGTTNSSDTGLVAGNYYVIITDNTGCKDSLTFTMTNASAPVVTVTPTKDTICNGGNVVLTAAGGQTYTWLPVTGLSCNTCPNPTASPTTTTIYTVTGDSNGCQATATATVTIYAPPVITLTATPDTVCIGQNTNLHASGAVTYSWAPSTGLSCNNCQNPICTPTAATTYTVIGTDAHGCTNASTITIYIAGAPNLTVSANISLCAGESTVLTASGTGTGFVWQPGNLSGPNISVTPSSTTTYTVSLNNGCGIATATVTVYVDPIPSPQFSADIRTGCSPLCIQFRDLSSVTSGKLTSWTWKFGDGDSLNAENPIYCYPNSGNYTVDLTVTTDSGCSATLKILNMITVYSHPVASFSLSPQPTTILQPTIQFTDKSTDVYGIGLWFWNFGDSDTLSLAENPSHTYHDTGTYCARLVVENIHGCTDTAINCLIIDPIFALYIPDAFSPNGNGINDYFLAKGNDIKTFEMYIFDRWGMQLFHSNDILNGWNGKVTTTGVLCQEDTYVYLINVTDHKDKKHSYTGKVNLIK